MQNTFTQIDKISDSLIAFAIDRNDLKIIIGQIPNNVETNKVAIEYELQLLKILTVGWSIPFFMGDNPDKQTITEKFWFAIKEFSTNISQVSASAANTEINYFEQIRNRLELYINTLNQNTDIKHLSSVIGPVFADCCGDKNDPFASISGAKMFSLAVNGVREYLLSTLSIKIT